MEKVIVDKLEYEKKYLQNGYKYIAGVDEVGRGPLAGPVVCASVIMPLDDIIVGIDDSKKLSKKKREKLYDEIINKAISYKICRVEPSEIEEINKNGETIASFRSCGEAEKFYGFGGNSIKPVCDGKRKHTRNKIFRWKNELKRKYLGLE